MIHQASAYKFDVFPVAGDMFRAAKMGRRQVESASPFGETIDIYFRHSGRRSAGEAGLLQRGWARFGTAVERYPG